MCKRKDDERYGDDGQSYLKNPHKRRSLCREPRENEEHQANNGRGKYEYPVLILEAGASACFDRGNQCIVDECVYEDYDENAPGQGLDD